MALTIGDDAYISLEAAQTYLSSVGIAAELTEANIRAATFAIDRLYGAAFIGYRSVPSQPLAWPRGGDIEIPVNVQRATAELAAMLANGVDIYAEVASISKERVKIDGAIEEEIVYQAGSAKSTSVLGPIRSLLAPLMLRRAASGLFFLPVVL